MPGSGTLLMVSLKDAIEGRKTCRTTGDLLKDTRGQYLGTVDGILRGNEEHQPLGLYLFDIDVYLWESLGHD